MTVPVTNAIPLYRLTSLAGLGYSVCLSQRGGFGLVLSIGLCGLFWIGLLWLLCGIVVAWAEAAEGSRERDFGETLALVIAGPIALLFLCTSRVPKWLAEFESPTPESKQDEDPRAVDCLPADLGELRDPQIEIEIEQVSAEYLSELKELLRR